MRKRYRNVIWGWLMIGGLAAGQVSARVPGDFFLGCCEARAEAPVLNAADDETDRFFKAKEFVFKREWRDARKGLESYLKDYPKGRLRDEALYWLAQSLNMLSKSAEGQEAILDLKRDAVRRLDSLAESFPESLWLDDGLALQVEIAGQLVLAGREEYKSYIDEAVATRKQDQRELKVLALNSLMGMDPDYALPIFRRMVEKDPDPDIRKRALALTAGNFPRLGRDIIASAARRDREKSVRDSAAGWLERISEREVPVRLSYSIYGCHLLDEGDWNRFPEGRVKSFPLPMDTRNHRSRILDRVRETLGTRISSPQGSANGSMPAFGLFPDEQRTTITHRAADYQLWIKPGKLKITPEKIRGEVQFRHRRTNEKFDAVFELARGENRLLVTRSGDKLSLLVLRFTEVAAGNESAAPRADPARIKLTQPRGREGSGSDLPDFGPFDIKGVFTLSSGLRVHTVRKYFDAAEFERNLINFQQSRALFSKNGEEWTLLGDIFWLKKQSRLIGFGAILVDEDRRIRARGLISVPLERPSDFEVLRGRPVEGRRLLLGQDERRTRGIFPTLYSSVQGWEVLTTLNSGHAGSENRQDYSLALATRSMGGTDWVLMGRILLLKQERRFIARDAALFNSDGEIVFGAELQVSTDDPVDFQVIKR